MTKFTVYLGSDNGVLTPGTYAGLCTISKTTGVIIKGEDMIVAECGTMFNSGEPVTTLRTDTGFGSIFQTFGIIVICPHEIMYQPGNEFLGCNPSALVTDESSDTSFVTRWLFGDNGS